MSQQESIISQIITTTNDVILSSYGVAGLSSKNSLREGIASFLLNTSFSDGIYVTHVRGNHYIVDIYIIVSENTRISEIILEAQKKISYTLNKNFPNLVFDSCNIYVDNLRKV